MLKPKYGCHLYSPPNRFRLDEKNASEELNIYAAIMYTTSKPQNIKELGTQKRNMYIEMNIYGSYAVCLR